MPPPDFLWYLIRSGAASSFFPIFSQKRVCLFDQGEQLGHGIGGGIGKGLEDISFQRGDALILYVGGLAEHQTQLGYGGGECEFGGGVAHIVKRGDRMGQKLARITVGELVAQADGEELVAVSLLGGVTVGDGCQASP